MKIERDPTLVVENGAGDFDTVEAGINTEDQGFFFEMLSKRLYSNPEGTIVREITSNCFDSHVEAEVNKPVIIRFTYNENQYFISFIDFGVGLSVERMKKVFMNYGSSTKRTTNKMIGGFGLGSKSPFAYSNIFNIITSHNGSKREYIMHQATMVPKLDLLIEEQCDVNDNGTEIRIPLKSHEDVSKFINEIKDQLFYFDNVFVQNDIPIGKQGSINSYNCGVKELNEYQVFNFKTFKYRHHENDKDKMHLVIDKVTYPIDFKQIKTSEIKIPIAVKFEIGEIQVTPSRESILYTEDSIKLIQERIKDCLQEISEIYKQQNVVNTFETFTKTTINYFNNKQITVYTNEEKFNFIIDLDHIKNIKINDSFIFEKPNDKNLFPCPQFKDFIDLGFCVGENIFKTLEYYKAIIDGKWDENSIMRLSSSVLSNYNASKKIILFDEESNRLKNRFLNNADFLKLKSFSFFYKNIYKKHESYKLIDLSLENKVQRARRFYNIFIDFLDKNYIKKYSKVVLTEEFKKMIEDEKNKNKVRFKDVINIETFSDYGMVSEKINEAWLKQYHLIVYCERKDDQFVHNELISAYHKFKSKINDTNKKKNIAFKYTFFTTAKRNIQNILIDNTKAIHLNDLIKKIESWNIKKYTSYIISQDPIISKILKLRSSFEHVNKKIYDDLEYLNQVINSNLGSLQIPSGVDPDKLLKNEKSYIIFKEVKKYFEDLIMLNYIDTYSIGSYDHKKISFKNTLIEYLKFKKKKLDSSHYFILRPWEKELLEQEKEMIMYQKEIKSMKSLMLNYQNKI